ncbi:hypothetical protein B0H10DRAFT_2230944 [Mycena sp. CBHHK59/15]|nr:hypothetical protein B0H10DRAFT_2230944 [Mycena sp. CBHHK59/15]
MIRVNLLALDDNDLGDFQPYPTTLFIALIGWHPTGGDEASPSLVPTLRGVFAYGCVQLDRIDATRSSLEASPCGAPGARMIFMPSAYSWLLVSHSLSPSLSARLMHASRSLRSPIFTPTPVSRAAQRHYYQPAKQALKACRPPMHRRERFWYTPFTAPLTHLSPTLPARMLDPDLQRAPREQGTTSPAEPDFHRPRCLCADLALGDVIRLWLPYNCVHDTGSRIDEAEIHRFRFRLDQRRSTHVALEATPDDAIRLPHWRDCHLGFDVTEAIRTRHLLPRRICRYSDPSGNAGTRGLLPSASARTITAPFNALLASRAAHSQRVTRRRSASPHLHSRPVSASSIPPPMRDDDFRFIFIFAGARSRSCGNVLSVRLCAGRASWRSRRRIEDESRALVRQAGVQARPTHVPPPFAITGTEHLTHERQDFLPEVLIVYTKNGAVRDLRSIAVAQPKF